MERNFREIARNAGDVEIHCGACGHTMEYAHLLWDIGMEPPCPKCRAMELRNDGWKQFWAENEHETRDAAIALGWLPRPGTSDELDIFLLPDGPEAPPEEYYDELCNALDWRQEQVREAREKKEEEEEEEEEIEAICRRCGERCELKQLHPDSIPIPESGDWYATHGPTICGGDDDQGTWIVEG